MKRLTAKEIKKIVLGVVLSDGHIDVKNQRFDFYSSKREYAEYVASVLNQITGMSVSFKVKEDKRGYLGYRVFTRKHTYWKNISKRVYDVRKNLNKYNVSRIDELSLANIWMCDGYLERAKNRKINKIQNIGWLCFEAFPKKELELLQQHLEEQWGIKSTLVTKKHIKGFKHRIRMGGENLQKLISIVYPHILDCFKYKTELFYKKQESANMSLPSAEHFIKTYNEVDDIVRYYEKS